MLVDDSWGNLSAAKEAGWVTVICGTLPPPASLAAGWRAMQCTVRVCHGDPSQHSLLQV